MNKDERDVSREIVKLDVELPVITCMSCKVEHSVLIYRRNDDVIQAGKDLYCPICGNKSC